MLTLSPVRSVGWNRRSESRTERVSSAAGTVEELTLRVLLLLLLLFLLLLRLLLLLLLLLYLLLLLVLELLDLLLRLLLRRLLHDRTQNVLCGLGLRAQNRLQPLDVRSLAGQHLA